MQYTMLHCIFRPTPRPLRTCSGLDSEIRKALVPSNVGTQLDSHAAGVDTDAIDPGGGEQQGEHAPASIEIIVAAHDVVRRRDSCREGNSAVQCECAGKALEIPIATTVSATHHCPVSIGGSVAHKE